MGRIAVLLGSGKGQSQASWLFRGFFPQTADSSPTGPDSTRPCRVNKSKVQTLTVRAYHYQLIESPLIGVGSILFTKPKTKTHQEKEKRKKKSKIKPLSPHRRGHLRIQTQTELPIRGLPHHEASRDYLYQAKDNQSMERGPEA